MADTTGLNISTTGRLVTGSFPRSRPDFIGAVAEVTSDTSTGSWEVQSAGRHSSRSNTVSVAELLARDTESGQGSSRSRRSTRQASQEEGPRDDAQQPVAEQEGSTLVATLRDGSQQVDAQQVDAHRVDAQQASTEASIQHPLQAPSTPRSKEAKTTVQETSLVADLFPPRVRAEQQPTSREEAVAPPSAAGIAAAATQTAPAATATSPAVADSAPAAAEVASNKPDIAALDTAQVIDVEVVTAPSSRGMAEPVDVDFHIFDGPEDDPIAFTVAVEEPAEPALTDLTSLVAASALPQDPAGSLERRRDSVEVVEHWEQPDIAPVPFSATSEALALLQFDDPESPAYTRPSAQRQLQRMYLSYVMAVISAALSLVACIAGWVAENSWLGFSGQALLCAAFAAAFSAEWFFRPSKKL